MESRTGSWVTGDDFFGRETNLRILGMKVREQNHVLLSGPRRIGKTSVAQELGRRLAEEGWTFLYLDVEHVGTPEEFVLEFAARMWEARPLWKRRLFGIGRWVGAQAGRVKKVGAAGTAVELHREMERGTWRQRGDRLFRQCVESGRRVFLVLDELPLFLKRLLESEGGRGSVELFLSWLRGTLQMIERNSPVLLISGSMGLYPFVERLRLTDRINYLSPYRLQPWSREESIECLDALAAAHGITWAQGAASDAYDRLGEGNPHQIQCFFAALRQYVLGQEDSRITCEDNAAVYPQLLLPGGQNDLAHYQHRLERSLDAEDFAIAMEILVETANKGVLGRSRLMALVAGRDGREVDVTERVRSVLDMLMHDGYLSQDEEYCLRFTSRLLQDWFSTRPAGQRDRDASRGSTR